MKWGSDRNICCFSQVKWSVGRISLGRAENIPASVSILSALKRQLKFDLRFGLHRTVPLHGDTCLFLWHCPRPELFSAYLHGDACFFYGVS